MCVHVRVRVSVCMCNVCSCVRACLCICVCVCNEGLACLVSRDGNDGVGFNILGCRVDILWTNCNLMSFCDWNCM